MVTKDSGCMEPCKYRSNPYGHTTSLHFLIVSRFPRLSSAFLALEEKLSVDKVLDKFEALGLTCTTNKIFELLPARTNECKTKNGRRWKLAYSLTASV
jgi:hypothetical protein